MGDDRHGAALLVIDVQLGLFNRPTRIYNEEELLANIGALTESAREAGVPVIYIQHSDEKLLVEGSEEWSIHPRIAPTELDLIVHKRHGNAFQDTILDREMKSRGVGTLVVTGLVTHGCVKATCMGAFELGYRVVLVRDGHSNYSKQAKEMIEKWNRRLSDAGAGLSTAAAVDWDVIGD